jgi:hypothetical protein
METPALASGAKANATTRPPDVNRRHGLAGAVSLAALGGTQLAQE